MLSMFRYAVSHLVVLLPARWFAALVNIVHEESVRRTGSSSKHEPGPCSNGGSRPSILKELPDYWLL
jgi:hypothetical protein